MSHDDFFLRKKMEKNRHLITRYQEDLLNYLEKNYIRKRAGTEYQSVVGSYYFLPSEFRERRRKFNVAIKHQLFLEHEYRKRRAIEKE